jgi:hypothetical protein
MNIRKFSFMIFVFLVSCGGGKSNQDTQEYDSNTSHDTILPETEDVSTDSSQNKDLSPYDPGSDTSVVPNCVQTKELSIKIVGPSGDGFAMVMSGVVQVAGVIFGCPDSITWETQSGASGIATGAPYFETEAITLNYGDNKIIVTATKDNVSVSDSIIVSYNPGFLTQGPLNARPDALFVGEQTTVNITLGLGLYKNFDKNSVELLQVDQGGNVLSSLGKLVDDGQVETSCDEIQDDGVFSKCANLTCANEQPILLKAKFYVMLGGQSYWGNTAIKKIECVKHLSVQNCNAHKSLLQEAKGIYLTEMTASGNKGSAKKAALEFIKTSPDVVQTNSSVSDSGIWVFFSSGALGALNLPDDGARGSEEEQAEENTYENETPDNEGDTAAIEAAALHKILIMSKNVLLLSPFNSELSATDESSFFHNILKGQSCPYYTVGGPYNNGTADVSKFRHANQYGIISIVSHGDVYFNDLAQDTKNSFNWTHSGSQELIWTGEPVNCNQLQQSPKTWSSSCSCPAGTECLVTKASGTTLSGICMDYNQIDLMRGRLVIGAESYGVLPSFFPRYANPKFPDSLIYLGVCKSLYNGTMAESLIASGAKTIMGFTGTVSSLFAQQISQDFFAKLIEEKKLTGEAFGILTPDPSFPGTFFNLFGAKNLLVTDANLINESFETGDLTGWSKEGDGRVVSKLCEGSCKSTPVSGKFMGLISTGMGFTVQTGLIEQTFCIPETITDFTFYWRYYSEEFHEWCGSQYMDAFKANFTSPTTGKTSTVVDAIVDDLCAPNDNGCFSCGKCYKGLTSCLPCEFDIGDVHATSWQKSVENIAQFAGKGPVTLSFFTTDAGDSIYDTVVLIDHLKFDSNNAPSSGTCNK